MTTLPLYAAKGRGSGLLWVEVAPENMRYIVSAFDERVASLSPVEGEAPVEQGQQQAPADQESPVELERAPNDS